MSRESFTVDSTAGIKLDVRIYKPPIADEHPKENPVIVLVHPYSVLGGCQALMRGIARELSSKGFTSVTFDMRGAGKSTGRPSLTGFSEVNDVVSVCKWVSQNLSLNRILLVGSSAGLAFFKCLYWIAFFMSKVQAFSTIFSVKSGAAIAGSAVDKVEEVVGYVSLGYPFGLTASILFGRHHKAILESPKPKLFVMGTKDGFTSVKQLQNKLKSAAGRVETHLIEGVSHFQMEGPGFDSQMGNLIVPFISSF
ncbi:hypothetical protein LguiA_014480 [Lonicera macranthoides]